MSELPAPSMPFSIWCIRRGTWRHGAMRTDALVCYSSPAGSIRQWSSVRFALSAYRKGKTVC